MKVRILYDNLQTEIREEYYYSKYSRINAKGIKEEAKNKLIERFGKHAKNYDIIKLYREE